jgi:uncharacterized protein (TIGR03086 family)
MSASGGLPPAVLEEAVGFALCAAAAVTPDLLSRPTPCRGWDLRMLLLHAGESAEALAEGFGTGWIGLLPASESGEQACDPVLAFRRRARALLVAGRAARPGRDGSPGREVVVVADCPMGLGLLVAAGALEVAVHGWDVATACGSGLQIPAALALDLLESAPVLVTAAGRGQLFAPPLPVPAAASPSDRLTAFLGRSPRGTDPADRAGRHPWP